MMASVFGAGGDIEPVLKTLGSDEAIILSHSALVALWTTEGGQGQTQARHSLPQACDTLQDWFSGGEQMRWTRGQTNA